MKSPLPRWRRAAAVLIGLCALLAVPAWAAVDPDDLLPVDEAFVLDARAPTRERVEIRFRVADGYYLYRHRMAAAADGFDGAGLQLPDGKRHVDEFFGEVETYRGTVTAVLEGGAPAGASALSLEVKFQGCADIGVCYPPQARTLRVPLPAADAGPGGADGDGRLAALGRALGAGARNVLPVLDGTASQPLPPERAFGFEAIAADGDTILMRFTPAPGYYLYRDRSEFGIEGAAGIAAGSPRWPAGTGHRDEYFGEVVVYFDQVHVPLPLRRDHGDAAEVVLVATFQGCQDEGICYPPMTRRATVALPGSAAGAAGMPPSGAAAPATAASAAATEAAPAPAPAPAPDPAAIADAAAPAGSGAAADAEGTTPWTAAADAEEAAPSTVAAGGAAGDAPRSGADAAELADDSRLAAALAGPDRLLALLGFLGAGLLLAFTPCVLPMIPILSGLIAGAGTRLGTGRALLLSFVYVFANALVFTAAGVVAALLGANLQIAFQTPWVIVLFALLFVALALSQFGLYELQLPAAVRARLGALSDRQRGGSLPGVAAMGALSALIVGPCVAPPLAAAVLYIGETGDPVFGGAALFLLAMGMGLPLLAFGVAAGRGLPTSGPWMVAVQRVFGMVFLGLAVWMLSRIVPGPATLALYGLLALGAAAWAFSAHHQTPRARLLARYAGMVLAVVGAAQLFGALAGSHDPLRPLAGALGGPQGQAQLPFRTIKTVADLDRELAAAQAAGQPLMFDFYADWCVSCKEMEKYTFTEPEVHRALAGFVLLKADVTANDADDQALMQRFGIVGPPATLFFVEGAERRALRLFGFEKAPLFAARARRAAPVAEAR
ncbi:protein-disulfide reductase DsbD [Luteimonas sp. SJ-92]|uniref:Thiol:disulfide interchange protein DsbD n=1 Tax=Luteimonas salinisoli TaxID=2752307 RepID=A0A853J8G4_9GAMM|nr:protein-disulfide reductase DsbD [Luteimonas salinisoli]NZA25062.1 protein-disulfide reductase DsbD [Luteimonas salinisoli]